MNEFRRKAIMWSLVLHSLLVTGLLYFYAPNPFAQSSRAQSVITASAIESPDEDSARGQQLTEPQIPARDPPVSTTSPGADGLRNAIEQAADEARDLPADEKLSSLEQNLRQLDAIASDESVGAIADMISGTLGLQQNQPNQEAADDGPFDFDTAQLQDVTRIKSASGGWTYTSIMVDSKGRSLRVEMGEADGSVAYETFQQIKKYPFAEALYRQVVMPMIQEALAPKRKDR